MTVNFNLDGMALRTNPDYDYLPEPDDPSLPEVHPYDHQIDTYETVLNNDNFLILNTSPTGGGKTYSWLAAAVERGLNVIAMYPTNALIRDQLSTVNTFLDNYRTDKDVETLLFTGDSLQEMREDAPESVISNAETIERKVTESFRTSDSVILFTNPDIFTKLRHGDYNSEPRRQTDRFDMVVFDEFHLADMKGQNSLLYLMEDMYHDDLSNTSKFMLLSATPEEWLADKIRNYVDIPSYTINCSGDGRAALSDVADDDGSVPGNWRAIMPAVNIEFREGNTFDTSSELLNDENLSEFTDFCRQGDTVVMLDALREVNETHKTLQSHLPDSNIYRIDGLTRGDVEHKLNEFDVLTSNSAVEVGIDFEADQLVFSGHNSDKFLQRIGRLRAHSGQYEEKEAICYVPRPIMERMAKANQVFLDPDRRVSRDRFERIINNAYPEPTRPELFGPLYTALEMFAYADDRGDDMTSDQRREYMKRAYERIRRHCFDPEDYEMTKHRTEELIRLSQTRLVDTLRQYRGGGLSTLMYDRTEGEVKSYTLTSILRYGDVEFVSEGEFMARIPDEHVDAAAHESKFTVGYCIYNGYREFPSHADEEDRTGRDVYFTPSAPLYHQLQKEPSDPDRRPIVTEGLQIRVEDEFDIPSGLEKLNAELQEEPLTCYAVEGSSYAVQGQYDLDDFFFLSELTNTRGEYTLALGLNALYLHCHDRSRQGLQPLLDMEPSQTD